MLPYKRLNRQTIPGNQLGSGRSSRTSTTENSGREVADCTAHEEFSRLRNMVSKRVSLVSKRTVLPDPLLTAAHRRRNRPLLRGRPTGGIHTESPVSVRSQIAVRRAHRLLWRLRSDRGDSSMVRRPPPESRIAESRRACVLRREYGSTRRTLSWYRRSTQSLFVEDTNGFQRRGTDRTLAA